MRGSVLLLGGAAALVGVGLIARSGERAPLVDGIVVVRGGATGVPIARAIAAKARPQVAASPAVSDGAGTFGDPGIWATPAEFDRPEPAD